MREEREREAQRLEDRHREHFTGSEADKGRAERAEDSSQRGLWQGLHWVGRGDWGRGVPSDATGRPTVGRRAGSRPGHAVQVQPRELCRKMGAGRKEGLGVSGEPAVRFRLKNFYEVPETRSYYLPQGKVPTHLAVSAPCSLAHWAAFWTQTRKQW